MWNMHWNVNARGVSIYKASHISPQNATKFQMLVTAVLLQYCGLSKILKGPGWVLPHIPLDSLTRSHNCNRTSFLARLCLEPVLSFLGSRIVRAIWWHHRSHSANPNIGTWIPEHSVLTTALVLLGFSLFRNYHVECGNAFLQNYKHLLCHFSSLQNPIKESSLSHASTKYSRTH